MEHLETQIKDDDLQEQLKQCRGNPGYGTMLEMLVRKQQQRDKERALTPVKRRRLQTRKHVEAKENEDRHHIHSVLALCGLPYRRPPDGMRDYVREYGKNSLVITSGHLKDPLTGKMELQGLPYGPKARLLLLHICTMAMRQQNPEIEIAGSMSAFIRELGFSVTGGKKGTLTQFKEQLNRLAATRMQIGFWRGEKTSTLNSQPIEAFDIWLPQDPDQKILWSSTLRLDQKFYESLRKHALPVDMTVLRAFSQSAKQIDIVLWLAYRLRGLNRTLKISWKSIQEQFGSNVSSQRKFKQSFAEDLKAISEVFPNLPVKLTDEAIILFQCDADKLFIAPKSKRLKYSG